MNKKILLIISLCFLFILTLTAVNIYTLEVSKFSNYMDTFGDNYIIAGVDHPYDKQTYRDYGFAYTKEEQKEIENIEHVENTTFTDSVLASDMPSILFDHIENDENGQLYNEANLNFYGNYATMYNQLDKNLDYIYGHEITKNEGIVISEQMANTLLDYNLFNVNKKEELISQTFNKFGFNYEIEGIYKTNFTTSPKFYAINYESYQESLSYYNSFIVYMPKSYYSSINHDKKSIISQINGWNQQQATLTANDDKIIWLENVDDYGTWESTVVYDKSVKAGAVGLINPDDFDKYDSHLYNAVIIKVDDTQNKQSVINRLNEMENVRNITTNDTKMSDLTTYPNIIKYVLFSFIILFILLYYKYFSGNLKESFIHLLIASSISILFATLFTSFLSIHVFISNTIVIFTLAFVCICFITLLKYITIKMYRKN